MVEETGLENQEAGQTVRGFESLPLRHYMGMVAKWTNAPCRQSRSVALPSKKG